VLDLVGRPLPDVYSAALSEFVFAAGLALMTTRRPDVTYLSTTDYVQHKHAPGTEAANAFHAMIDGYLARLDALGCVIALTADHGMNAKTRLDASPDVIYLQDRLDRWIGTGRARTILPITDPYVVHHGALGSFALAYLPPGIDAAALRERIAALPGIESVLSREAAAARFELPADRIGDLVVVSRRDTVIGTSESRHDLSALEVPLRSHGGVSEQQVPLMVNRRVAADAGRRWRNFDAFDLGLNLAA
jgi:phosphonoacetate hydrolase